MDKVMKAEIEKILSKYIWFDPIEHVDVDDEQNDKNTKELIDTATSSLTSLIIKWLEGKKIDILDHHEKYHKDCHRCIEIFACNQLITELIGEVRNER
jgi:hypothetical protein